MVSPAKVRAVFASAILLLFVCAAFSYLSFFYFRSSERSVSHTLEVRAVTGDLAAALDDASRARMAYLLNGAANHLAQYRNAVEGIATKAKALRDLTGDNPVQRETTATLENVNNSRVAAWEEAVARRQHGQPIDIAQVIAANVAVYGHPTSTVPMGGPGDPWAVVDSVGAVKGVSGLRVVDASIMPEVLSSTTNVTTIMLAERICQRVYTS